MFKTILCITTLVSLANICSAQQYVDALGSCGGNTPCNLTIQSAVTAATPGSLITVYPGTYSEKVTIDKAITLQSTGGAGSTTIQFPLRGNYEAPIMIPSPASNVTIGGLANKGFTIIGMDNTNDAAGAGMESGAIIIGAGATSMSNINISYNTLTANGEAALLTYYSGSNYLSGLSITHNLINGKTFEGAAPVAGGPFTNYNAAKPAVAINQGAQNVVFSQNVISAQTGGSGTGNSLVLINAAGSTVNENTFNGTIAGTSAALLSLRGTAATMQCNLLTLANSPGARFLLSTNGTAPYSSATVAGTNTFLPATIYYFGPSFYNITIGAPANSVDPAPGCNTPLPNEGIKLYAEMTTSGLLKTKWELAATEAGNTFEIQTACQDNTFETIDRLISSESVAYERKTNLHENCRDLLVRIRQDNNAGRVIYSNVALVTSTVDDKVLVYPNPVNDKISIKTRNLDNGYVLLYDYTGRETIRKPISGMQHIVDVSTLPQGMYLLKIVTGSNTVYSGKIVK